MFKFSSDAFSALADLDPLVLDILPFVLVVPGVMPAVSTCQTSLGVCSTVRSVLRVLELRCRPGLQI